MTSHVKRSVAFTATGPTVKTTTSSGESVMPCRPP